MHERSLGAKPVEAARVLLIAVMVALFFSPPVTVLLELTLFALMLSFGALRARLWHALRQPMGALALAFWLVVTLGLLYGVAPREEAFNIWLSWRRVLLLAVGFALFDEARAKRQLAWTFVVVATACALASYGGVLLDFTYYKYEPGITVRNHATQGMFFAVAAFACVALFRVEETPATRVALGVAAVVLLANSVFITPGRSGYLVVAVLAAALVWGWPAQAPLRRAAWASGAVILALAVLASSPVVRQRVAQGVDEALTYREKTTGFTSIGVRVAFLRNTVELIAARPVIGYGTGSFESAYTALVKGRPGMEGRPTHDPHNQFLKIAAEHGLIGLLVFLALLLSAFRQTGVPPPYRLLGLGVLAAWCATSLFNSHFSTFAEGRFIWLWVGACLAAPQKEA
jgi:O-antigen ligase